MRVESVARARMHRDGHLSRHFGRLRLERSKVEPLQHPIDRLRERSLIPRPGLGDSRELLRVERPGAKERTAHR